MSGLVLVRDQLEKVMEKYGKSWRKRKQMTYTYLSFGKGSNTNMALDDAEERGEGGGGRGEGGGGGRNGEEKRKGKRVGGWETPATHTKLKPAGKSHRKSDSFLKWFH